MGLNSHTASWSPTDAELVLAAQGGHGPSLGLLLERHRPRLFATALRLLGYRPDAEDAVQETCLIAMRYIGSVRDPDSVGAWLHAVLRRSCLLHRRRRRGEVLTDDVPEMTDESSSPEERIERLELREWIWGALQQLPETLRVTAMLRFFGSYDSYDEVAAILGIPIGTVRSRLSHAKVKLADALLASAGLMADDARTRARERTQFWSEAVRDVFRRGDSGGFISHFDVDCLVGWSNGKEARGRVHLAAEINGDLEAGVRLEPERVLSGGGIEILEGRFVNPAENPDHCPPGVAVVLLGHDDRKSIARLHVAARLPRAGEE
jgi:RNA polymerase sigma-70 factor (ECF subfamily)